MNFGLTLPNRGVLFGATTVDEMLTMAETAERSKAFASVWVGDSLLGKPRLESIALLAAIAGRTTRVRLGPACMASFVLRDPVLLAYQWASLDLIAGGRTVLVACTGIIPQEGGKIEGQLYGVTAKDRVGRLVEWIKLIRRLWTEDNVTFDGEHYRCSGITVDPKPAAKPSPPIWIANNSRADRATIERTHRRVARHADGWQTSISEPADVAWRIADIRTKTAEAGRDPDKMETHLYHNININADRTKALEESKRFLDTYYATDFTPTLVSDWTAAGTPEECAEHLRVFQRMGFNEITLRCTSWDQRGQLERVISEVLPLLQR